MIAETASTRHFLPVAKPALGRSLGNLLGDTQITAKPDDANAASSSSTVEVSAGLGNLLRTGKDEQPNETRPIDEQSSQKILPLLDTRASDPFQLKSEPVNSGEDLASHVEKEKREPRIPGWILLAADGLLVGMAALIAFKSPAPLKSWELLICASAIVFGGILGCSVFWRR